MTSDTPGKPVKARLAAVLRPLREGDKRRVFSDWLRSHKQWGDWTRCMRTEDYRSRWEPVIAGILGQASVIVAADPDDDDHVFGWLAYDGPLLHYVHTAGMLRGAGVATQMAEQAELLGRTEIVATHWTLDAGALRRAGWPLRYLPLHTLLKGDA